MANVESDHPDFWTPRYASGETPWNYGGTPPPLERFLRNQNRRGKVLIPGCGFGYEVSAFYRAGFEVTALDFSPVAVQQARQILGELGDLVTLGDFFTYDFKPAAFDLIYERAFLCALPPSRWAAYAKRMAYLLPPQGQLLGIFLHGEEAEPPPYPLSADIAEQLFGPDFILTRSEPIPDSMPAFRDMESWQEWTRR